MWNRSRRNRPITERDGDAVQYVHENDYRLRAAAFKSSAVVDWVPRGCGRLQSVKRRAAAAADDDEDDDDNDGDIDIEEDLVYKLTEAVKKQYGTIYVHTQRKLLSYVVQQYQASTC